MTAPAATPVRADDLTDRRRVAATYFGSGSARVLLVAAVGLTVARFAVGEFGRGDLIVLLATAVIAGPVEWTIHRFLLHAPPASWTSRVLGTGLRHREHHLDPPAIDWLMLRGVDACVFVVAFGAVTAAWTLPLLALSGSALLGPYLTAWALAAIGLAHYEWVHLLVHSRHRCRNRYYARLARNHRRHHYRNERYWLGVTTNSGDRLLGTYPAATAAVEHSETARTLG